MKPRNGFLALGPNVTGYPGGYPNGYFEAIKRLGYWGSRRLHLCSGSVKDGITADIDPTVRPTVVCDLEFGIPFREASFDTVLIDPPYSPEMAGFLYERRLLNIPQLLRDAVRVVKPDRYIVLLDWTVWAFSSFHEPKGADPVALYAVYVANLGSKPLRALQVWRRKPRPLDAYAEGDTPLQRP